MTLVYKADAIAGLMGGLSAGLGSPRAHKEQAMQLVVKSPKMVWVTKNAFARYVPYTVFAPTQGQAKWRLRFAESASNWKGVRGLAPLKYNSKKHKAGDVVLAVQAKAQDVLKNLRKSTTIPTLPEELKAKNRYKLHTAEELKKLAGEA